MIITRMTLRITMMMTKGGWPAAWEGSPGCLPAQHTGANTCTPHFAQCMCFIAQCTLHIAHCTFITKLNKRFIIVHILHSFWSYTFVTRIAQCTYINADHTHCALHRIPVVKWKPRWCTAQFGARDDQVCQPWVTTGIHGPWWLFISAIKYFSPFLPLVNFVLLPEDQHSNPCLLSVDKTGPSWVGQSTVVRLIPVTRVSNGIGGKAEFDIN